MSKLFLVDIDMSDNEIQNAIIQPLATAPQSAKVGKIYYNTTDSALKIYDGTQWCTIGSAVSVSRKLSSGVEIGSVTVDGVETKLFAPSGGSSPTAEDITANCSITKTSGGSATLVSAIRCGNMLGLVITVTASSSIAAGSDIFSGTFNGPTPLVGGAAPGYYGGRALACIISPEKTINVRYMAGSSNYASGNSTTFRLNFLVGD